MSLRRYNAATAILASLLTVGLHSVSAFAPSSLGLERCALPSATALATTPDVVEPIAEVKIKPVARKKVRRKSTSGRRKDSGGKNTIAAEKTNRNSTSSGTATGENLNGRKAKGKAGQKRKTFLSKPAGKAAKRELKPLSELSLGQTITGYVAGITDFGAFMKTDYRIRPRGDAGYALLHKSQISDEKVENISDVLKTGQEVDNLRVIKINYAKGEVGLSLRDRRKERFPLNVARRGETMRGRVANVVAYGAFIDVGCKINALLHVSRISPEKVENINDHIKEGDWVDVRIIDVDTAKRTMACSTLEKKADEFIDRRQRNRRIRDFKSGINDDSSNDDLKTELQFFEEAIKELEEAFE